MNETMLVWLSMAFSHAQGCLLLLQVNGHLEKAVVLESRAMSVVRVVALLPLIACLLGMLAVGASLLQPSLLV
jgi:hypothetical protein